MTRGIQLKRLSMEDLLALGIPESALRNSEIQDLTGKTRPDPTPKSSAKLTREARQELQAVLTLLEEALKAVGANPDDTQPRRDPRRQ